MLHGTNQDTKIILLLWGIHKLILFNNQQVCIYYDSSGLYKILHFIIVNILNDHIWWLTSK